MCVYVCVQLSRSLARTGSRALHWMIKVSHNQTLELQRCGVGDSFSPPKHCYRSSPIPVALELDAPWQWTTEMVAFNCGTLLWCRCGRG